MLILSLDTTTRAGSCALWRDGVLMEERVGDATRTHAERLPRDLADLLAAHGLAVRDVDLYAVASGPGSFTGLRVGIATVQALALVHGRRVVPVSALEALAQCGARALLDADATGAASTAAGQVLGPVGAGAGGAGAPAIGAWMEAYRGEVFGALYRVVGAGADDGPQGAGRKAEQAGLVDLEEIAPPAVADPEALAAEWRQHAQTPGVVETAPVGGPGGNSAGGNSAGGNSAGGNSAGGNTVIGVIIGDAVPATRAILAVRFPDARLLDAVPLAGTIARLAHAHPDRAIRPHAIVPLYVRRPDAELARARTS